MFRALACLPTPRFDLFRCLLVIASLCLSVPALGAVVQAPAGGGWLTLPTGHVLCAAPSDGWVVDVSRRKVRPPSSLEAAGRRTEVNAASSAAECSAGRSDELTLIATGRVPRIEPGSVVLQLDAGRLEFEGQNLAGLRIEWKGGKLSGSGVCPASSAARGKESCALPVDSALSADPSKLTVAWSLAHGRGGSEVYSYDERGRPIEREDREISVARVLLTRAFAGTHMLDLSSGVGRIELVHPDSVGGVECTGAQCDLQPEGIRVRSVPLQVSSVSVRLRLAPNILFVQASGQSETTSDNFDIVRCPMSIVSGPLVRNVDDAQLLARLDPVCTLDPDALHWTLNGDSLSVVKSVLTTEGAFVLLRAGRVNDESVVLVASQAKDKGALAVARVSTWELPVPRTTLMLTGYGEIDFVPKNRDAVVLVTPIAQGRLLPRGVPGAYAVAAVAGETRIRGLQGSSGYTALRLGYRPDHVPASFADTDFATVVDPVQRPLREANVPSPIGASSISRRPIVELVCGIGGGQSERIAPGHTRHIPFTERDSCRLVIHRDRIREDSGEQLLQIDVSVSDVSGADQGDARSSQRLLVRNEAEPEVLWIRGARHQFDRIKVEVSHVPDESVYLISRSRYSPAPSSQWVVVTEDAAVKFYATAAIPASLYRFSTDPENLGNGPLSLNFGVLSRFTILDDDGHESLLGLEGGVMGMGLATDKDRQLAVVSGLGVSVPIGNPNQPTQAAINIHAWMAYSLGTRKGQLLDTMGQPTSTIELSPWAFVFGPSITVGNVAAFL